MPQGAPEAPAKPRSSLGRSAVLVAAGIFLSRLAGLVRQRALAHYFAVGMVADAFTAAFRIPNFLQNLFGEGVLSASFIPVYAKLRAERSDEEAEQLAGAIATILALMTAVIVLLGVVFAPQITPFLAKGFKGEQRELTVQLVRVFFPGAGFLVMSAWCLGILNSHRKFFLSYVAPVVWNAAMVVAMVTFGRRVTLPRLAVLTAWGSVVGSALQFAVQLPFVLALLEGFKVSFAHQLASVREVLRNFFPVFFSRGVVQTSAYVDQLIASFLPTGAVAGLGYAQVLYTLPVSLFGMSISAAELPEMSSALGEDSAVAEQIRGRLTRALRQIAFLVVPSTIGFLALGDVIAAALFQSGRFSHENAVYVWGILAGSTVGLLASCIGRLYSSTFYALRDTRTPLRFAIVRVALTTVLGYLAALPLPRLLGVDPAWGAAGLTATAGFAGWVEFLLLRRSLHHRIGAVTPQARYFAQLWFAGAIAAAAGVSLKYWGIGVPRLARHPIIGAAAILGVYGLLYFAVAIAMKIPEVSVLRRFVKR